MSQEKHIHLQVLCVNDSRINTPFNLPDSNLFVEFCPYVSLTQYSFQFESVASVRALTGLRNCRGGVAQYAAQAF